MPHSHYEPGIYTANIVGQRFGETPNGTPYFALEFEPTSAAAPTNFPMEVYKRDLTLYFSDKAAPYSIEKLRRIGWNGTQLVMLDPENPKCESLSGIEIECVCRINDKGYDEWDLTAPGGGAATKESKQGVASKLDRRFGKALKTALPQKLAQRPATVPDDTQEDDTPF